MANKTILKGCSAEGNGGHGFNVGANANVEIIGSTAKNNMLSGFNIQTSSEQLMKELGFTKEFDSKELGNFLEQLVALKPEDREEEVKKPSFVNKFTKVVANVVEFGANLIQIVSYPDVHQYINTLLYK